MDLAKTFERMYVPEVWTWATHFEFSRKILLVLRGYFEHQRRVQFEGCMAEQLQSITAIVPGSNWSCLLLRIMLQDALSEVTKNCPHLKLRVFVDDITAFMSGRNKELVEVAQKHLKKLRMEVQQKGLKLSITEGGKEGKSKAITSCKYLDQKFQECSKKEGVLKHWGVDLRTRTKQFGREGEGEKEEV